MLADDIEHATPQRMTRAEYDRMVESGLFTGERVELIHGIIRRMSPIGPPHRRLVDLLTELFVPQLLGRARVSIQQPFVACDESEPEVDVAILPLADYGSMHPHRAHLLVEVSQTSLEYDRTTKATLYASSGVEEYWIVNVPDRVVEVHTGPKDGRYVRMERAAKGATLAPLAFPDAVVPVDRLFPPVA